MGPSPAYNPINRLPNHEIFQPPQIKKRKAGAFFSSCVEAFKTRSATRIGAEIGSGGVLPKGVAVYIGLIASLVPPPQPTWTPETLMILGHDFTYFGVGSYSVPSVITSLCEVFVHGEQLAQA